MTVAPNSAVVIALQSEWDELKKFLQSQGYDVGNGNELSASGTAPATHRGAHAWLSDVQAQEFTLRITPKSFDKYTLAEAQACMEKFSAREDGANINYGLTPDGSRASDIRIANATKALSTPRQRYDAVLAERGLREILAEEPEAVGASAPAAKG